MKEQSDIRVEEESVEYCKSCLSLAILDDEVEPFCNVCGSTDIGFATIEEWQEMYVRRHGSSYINDKSKKWEQEKRKNINKVWKSID